MSSNTTLWLSFTLLSCFNCLAGYSQTLPVGTYTEEIARRAQVIGTDSNKISFTIRPITSAPPDSLVQSLVASRQYLKFNFMGIASGLRLLPVTWLNEYHISRPYGYNNGSLYPVKGYQSMLSAGISVKVGPLNIQLRPEIVYAQNDNFSTFIDIQAKNESPQLMGAYFGVINGIDAPERFGTSAIKRVYPGQSKITFSYKSFEAGVSTENLWWGPGIRNSIMMSNSAPGFFHWTFNSVRPLKTFIGSFEWQIIGGNLRQSGLPPDDLSKLNYGSDLYKPKPTVTRYISAYNINWQPKWLKGFYLGLSAYDYLDKDSVYYNKGILRKIVPVIIGSSLKENDINNGKNGDQQDFAYALNMRQLLPLYKAELYFEWARNDRTGNLSDLIQEPEHSSAYTFGGRKLFPLSHGRFIQIKSEITKLERAPTYLVRDEPSWYVHPLSPRDGYTNYGRYMGAGIGPGGNSFIFDISYIKRYNSFGLMIERQVHNNDLYYQAFTGTGKANLHWVDLATTFYTNIKYNKYLLSTAVTPIYTLNYQYKNGSSFNFHARINFTYFL